ncbi:TPA: LysR family transcriptional regulator [Klebsiella pneumoniae]|nr:LysR family transcriptional regulator [Klebsiella pneumoniae]
MTTGTALLLCRAAAHALPGIRFVLPLIYSPLLLKLPVLTASKSLRRSRKAGAARMDAG